jgi:hypothetical protein
MWRTCSALSASSCRPMSLRSHGSSTRGRSRAVREGGLSCHASGLPCEASVLPCDGTTTTRSTVGPLTSHSRLAHGARSRGAFDLVARVRLARRRLTAQRDSGGETGDLALSDRQPDAPESVVGSGLGHEGASDERSATGARERPGRCACLCARPSKVADLATSAGRKKTTRPTWSRAATHEAVLRASQIACHIERT